MPAPNQKETKKSATVQYLLKLNLPLILPEEHMNFILQTFSILPAFTLNQKRFTLLKSSHEKI